MEEIEVGEYVRTIYGEITRLKEGHTANGLYYYPETKIFDGQEKCNHISNRIIAKHSKNIIDLIEVGDYVNGKEVHKYNGNTGIVSINELGWTFIAFKDRKYPIETIVTREQFASMEYKVED